MSFCTRTYTIMNHFLKIFFDRFPLLQFEIRQLRAHLAQQDLDLAAEREAAMQIHHVWGKQSTFQEIDGLGPAGSDTECRANTREPRPPPGTLSCPTFSVSLSYPSARMYLCCTIMHSSGLKVYFMKG